MIIKNNKMRVAMNKIKIYLKRILCNVFRALWSESSHGKQQKPSERSFSNEVRRDFQTNGGNIYGLPKAESEYPLSHKKRIDAWCQILLEVYQNPQKYYK